MDKSLSHKVSIGAIWIVAATVFTRFLKYISAVITARLLEPSDFGLMAVASAVVSMTEGTTQTGFQSAIIQKQENPESFLNTAWTFEVVKHIIIFFVVFLAAPQISAFFMDNRATPILRYISIIFIFIGFRNIGVIYFKKNLDFGKQFLLEVIPIIADIIVVIILAYLLRSVWALVFACLANHFIALLVSYILHPYRPRFEFKIAKAKELFNFGKWILGSYFIVLIRDQGITLFLGKYLGMTILGFFNRGRAFSQMFFREIGNTLWKVCYPAYSQLQNDIVRFKKGFIDTLIAETFIGIPMAGGLLILCRDFTSIFLTDKWLPIVPIIQIFCLLSIFTLTNTSSLILFQASGNPAIGTKISSIGVIILLILIYPLSALWGASGTALSLFLSTLIITPMIWFMAIRIAKCNLIDFFKPILISSINTTLMILIVQLIKIKFYQEIKFYSFFFLIFIGAVSYFSLAYFCDLYFNYGIVRLIKERITVLGIKKG